MSPFLAEPTVRPAPTIVFEIYMAGDYDAARAACRAWCAERGACVSLTPVDYIYSGGEEAGFKATLINYPRFPKSIDELAAEAGSLGRHLMLCLGQASFSVQGPELTLWFSRRRES